MNLPDLTKAKAYLKTLPITVAYVFGSRVYGKPRPTSDLDIGVVPKANQDFDYRKQAEILSKLQELVPNFQVQLTTIQDQSSPILAQKMIKGIPLVINHQFDKNQFEVDTYHRYRRAKKLLNIYMNYATTAMLKGDYAR